VQHYCQDCREKKHRPGVMAYEPQCYGTQILDG
jgi:hypothetical protein